MIRVVGRYRNSAVSRSVRTLLAASIISALLLGGQVAASSAGRRTVVLKDIAFSPARLTIPPGTTVTFAFRDGTDHNVISRGSKRFKNIGARSSGSQKRTFTRGGRYRYECTLHPGMTGQIRVR